MSFFYLKKWYFDLVTPEGDAVYSYFIVARIVGFGQGYASSHLVFAGGREVRASSKTKFSAPDAAGNLRLGDSSFSNCGDYFDVHLAFQNLVLDLCYQTLAGPWFPTADLTLWRRGRRYLRWQVAQAAARVEGSMSLGHERIPIFGEGYQDIVETTVPPWKLPLAELIWGRAHCEGRVVVFNQVTTREGEVVQNCLIGQKNFIPEAAKDSSEEAATRGRQNTADNEQGFLLTRDDSDHETTIRHKAFSLRLKRRSILEEKPIATQERFKPEVLRRVLDRACGRPLELKMLSEADLETGGRAFQGQAIHERVVWNWQRKK